MMLCFSVSAPCQLLHLSLEVALSGTVSCVRIFFGLTFLYAEFVKPPPLFVCLSPAVIDQSCLTHLPASA